MLGLIQNINLEISMELIQKNFWKDIVMKKGYFVRLKKTGLILMMCWMKQFDRNVYGRYKKRNKEISITIGGSMFKIIQNVWVRRQEQKGKSN